MTSNLPAAAVNGHQQPCQRSSPLFFRVRKIGYFAAFALFALRIGTGWHFYKEGVKKFSDDFTSKYLLQEAKGPLADFYLMMIPDREGRTRLNRDQILADWKSLRERAIGQYGFDDAQKKKANDLLSKRARQLDWFFDENGEDIEEYFLQCDRLREAKADASTRDVEFRRKWIVEKQGELQSKVGPWLSEVEQYNKLWERDLNSIATRDQVSPRPLALPDPGAMVIDPLVKYGITAIGVCLILGLFTRFASLCGIVFLCSVLASQPYWIPEAKAEFAYYQVVELLALLVLLAFAAGQYAGLDYLVHHLRLRCCPPKYKGDDDV